MFFDDRRKRGQERIVNLLWRCSALLVPLFRRFPVRGNAVMHFCRLTRGRQVLKMRSFRVVHTVSLNSTGMAAASRRLRFSIPPEVYSRSAFIRVKMPEKSECWPESSIWTKRQRISRMIHHQKVVYCRTEIVRFEISQSQVAKC